MGVNAGYLGAVKFSGTPTDFTDETCALVSGKTYKISDQTKRVWDRVTVPTVEVDGSAVTPEAIDYLRGTVTVSANGVVTISGKYLPMSFAASCKGWDMSFSRDTFDDTHFTEDGTPHSGYRDKKQVGLYDSTISLTFDWIKDQKQFYEALVSGTPMLIELYPNSAGEPHVGWYSVSSDKVSSVPDQLVGETVDMELDGDGVGKSLSLAGTQTA
jgi:hypothetical protein